MLVSLFFYSNIDGNFLFHLNKLVLVDREGAALSVMKD